MAENPPSALLPPAADATSRTPQMISFSKVDETSNRKYQYVQVQASASPDRARANMDSADSMLCSNRAALACVVSATRCAHCHRQIRVILWFANHLTGPKTNYATTLCSSHHHRCDHGKRGRLQVRVPGPRLDSNFQC